MHSASASSRQGLGLILWRLGTAGSKLGVGRERKRQSDANQMRWTLRKVSVFPVSNNKGKRAGGRGGTS